MKTRPVSHNWLVILRSGIKKKMTETFFLLFVRFAELFKVKWLIRENIVKTLIKGSFRIRKNPTLVKYYFMLTYFCHHVDSIVDRPLATQQSNGLSNSARKTILWLFYQKHRKIKYINIFWTISLPTVQFDSFDKLSPTSFDKSCVWRVLSRLKQVRSNMAFRDRRPQYDQK